MSQTYNRETRFAVHDGEHNARLLAMRDDASFRTDVFAIMDLSFCDYVRTDAFGDLVFNFDGKERVGKIHARLADAFEAENGVPNFVARKATGLAAFAEWDAERLEEKVA